MRLDVAIEEKQLEQGASEAMLSTMSTGDVASAAAENGESLSLAGVGPLFSCPDCAYKTTSLRKLGRHRSVNHAGVKYRCEHCDFVTGYQSNYYRHRKQVHNGGMSQSALQAATVNSTASSQVQQQQQQPTNFRMKSALFRNGASLTQLSNFNMTEDQQLLAAAIMASSANAFRCDRCPYQASSADQLASHVSAVHHVDGQHVCGECGAAAATKSQLQEHVRTYHNARSQMSLPKGDYASLFNSLASNGAAALTAAHLIMAAAATGSTSYDLNLLASAATMASNSAMSQQRGRNNRDQAKTMDSSAGNTDGDNDSNCHRYYACVYDCDFASRSSRDYLHHLRDEHGERFAIYYCDECDDYATKFEARLQRHKALTHVGDSSPLSSNNDDSQKVDHNGFSKSNGRESVQDDDDDDDDDDDEEGAEQKLSIVIDHPNPEWNGVGDGERDEANGTMGVAELDLSCEDAVKNEIENRFQKVTRVFVDAASPIDASQNSDSSRHSAPTPPALNGPPSIVQQNRRQQTFHSRLHFRRRQQQQFCQALNHESKRMKKFLSEQEAIEIPSDSIGNEFDNDPDIKNRRCSVCGYQGKWISEMIRHKRVHTNERPFKCKYCSRTSKWKADLIRHVAKVHGYRVVSKYSRSKTFDDADQTAMKALKEASHCSTPPAYPAFGKCKLPAVLPLTASKRELSTPRFQNDIGLICDNEASVNLSVDEKKANAVGRRMDDFARLDSQDEVAANFETAIENGRFRGRKEQAVLTAAPTELASEKTQASAALFRQFYDAFKSNEINCNDKISKVSPPLSNSGTIPTSRDLRDVLGSKQLNGALEKYVMIKQAAGGEPLLKCRVCPYETRDLHTFRAHTQKHENKKPYLCSTCGYRSNWSSDVHKHIRLKKTGHETAYVVKLNDADPPGLAVGPADDRTPLAVAGRLSSSSDYSSPESALNLVRTTPNSCSASSDGDEKSVGQATWRCFKCDFEDDSRSLVVEHLQRSHQISPFACRRCDFSSLHRKACVHHAQSQHAGDHHHRSTIIENLYCDYRMKPASTSTSADSPISAHGHEQSTILDEDVGKRASNGKKNGLAPAYKMEDGLGNGSVKEVANDSPLDQATASIMAANAAAAAFATSAFASDSNGQAKSMDWLQLAHLYFLGGFAGFPMDTGTVFTSEATHTGSGKQDRSTNGHDTALKDCRCEKCPFVGSSISEAAIHGKGHQAPNKGLICYKCVFCDWYSPKKAMIFDHMKLHTDQPAMYKAEVEKNLITPLSRKRSADDSAESAAADALLGLAKAEKMFKLDEDNEGDCNVADAGKEKKAMLASGEVYGVPFNNEGLLGSSDVDDVMSDFNAIIHAADQDLGQENVMCDFSMQNQPLENGEANVGAANSPSVWMEKKKRSSSKAGFGSAELACSEVVDPTARTNGHVFDQEAYIHAGEDAFDSFPRLGELAKGEIQKVTAVVDGQVRKMWQCRHCPHMSKRRANVRMHEKKHFKSSAIGVFKCPKCNYRGDKRSLHVHYRVHMATENGGSSAMPELFQCSSCPAIFQSQDDLGLHVINHDNDSAKAYRCSQCSYSVSSVNALEKHTRVHDRQLSNNGDSITSSVLDERSAKRQHSTSNRRFANSAAIANVIVQHEEIATSPFSTISDGCSDGALNLVVRHRPESNAGASSRGTLSLQADSSSSPASFSSGVGPSRFAGSFPNPVAKPKKYLCTRCPAKFADRTQLNRHVQFHGVKLKFKCDLCDYSVPFPINLTKHMKSHHSMDVVDASSPFSTSDNDNESEMTADTDENGGTGEEDHGSEGDEDVDVGKLRGSPNQTTSESESFAPSPLDGSLKIKINLGTLKPSPSVA